MGGSSYIRRTGAIAVVLAICLLALTQATYAQNPPIRSEVDKTELSTDEVLTLTVTVSGGDSILGPLLPALENVNIVGRSTVTQTTIVNNRTSSELVHEYRLRPTIDGPLTIGAVRVTIDGQAYTTDPITVEVHPGARQSGAQPAVPTAEVSTELTGQDYYVEATVDNHSPRIGEQVVYTFKFYSAASFFGRSDYDGPELTGFWAREDPDQRRYRTTEAGRRYTVAEIRTVLFPTVVGPRIIAPAVITIPGGFFQQTARLMTRPVEIEVQPLPSGAPADFSGAVGRFSISAKTDGGGGAVVNEPLVLTVTLSGEGNIDLLPDPVWTDMAGWRTVDAPPTTNSRIEDGSLIGTRVYLRTLVPREAGDFTIPAVNFTYFDPKVDRYLRISTDPIPVTVFEGPARGFVPPLLDVDRDLVERLASDIRHIKPVPGSLAVADGRLTERGIFWAAMALPAALLAGATVWRRRRDLFGGSGRMTRSGRAYGRARSFLASAGKTGADPYATSAHALTQYLGDKLDQPATGLTHDSLVELLRSRGIASELVERTAACLVTSEGGRFAPKTSGLTSGEELVAETKAVLSELESQFESNG